MFKFDSKVIEQATLWALRLEKGTLRTCERRRYERWIKLPGRATALLKTVRFMTWLDSQLAE